jgi:polyhydroxyalkanoate synthesis repressor PhaR
MSTHDPRTRTIKRYANRKLYDTERSCYVTLEEIAEMVKSHENVKIIDNRTGEDLTGVTLTQIIFEDQKKTDQKKNLPLPALRTIIQSGGEIFARYAPGLRQRAEAAPKKQRVVYDLPEAAQRRVRLEEARRVSTMPAIEIHLDAIHGRIDDLEQSVERMERQLRVMTRLLEDIKQEVRRGHKGPDTLPAQKSKPILPL